MAAKTLELNEIGVCNLNLDRADRLRPVHARTATPGGFILIDRLTNATVGAGMLHFALRAARTFTGKHMDVNKAGARAA